MKKNLKRVICWILLSLTVQMGGLLYVDKCFLAKGKTVSKKVEVKEEKKKKPDAKIKIPKDVAHLNVSFDAKYVAYYQGEVLKIINTKTGQEEEVKFDNGVKVSYYSWLPDRNRMLIGEKHSDNNGVSFKLSFYDVDKKNKDEIKTLTWADSKSEIKDIKLSTLTNVIYVKVCHSGQRSSLYWINIMKDMRKVELNTYLLGDMAVIPHEDKLVYEDLNYKKINVTNIKEPLDLKGVNNPCLVAIDNNDKIYIGNVTSDKIDSVYYGLAEEPTSKWKNVKLPEAVNKKDIFVSSEGKIYTNDNLKGEVLDVVSGKKTVYEGIFHQMYNNGVITLDEDNHLIKVPFSK